MKALVACASLAWLLLLDGCPPSPPPVPPAPDASDASMDAPGPVPVPTATDAGSSACQRACDALIASGCKQDPATCAATLTRLEGHWPPGKPPFKCPDAWGVKTVADARAIGFACPP